MQFVKNFITSTKIYKLCEEKIKKLLMKIEKRNVKRNSNEKKEMENFLLTENDNYV